MGEFALTLPFVVTFFGKKLLLISALTIKYLYKARRLVRHFIFIFCHEKHCFGSGYHRRTLFNNIGRNPVVKFLCGMRSEEK
jgi:hypothetical protein